MSKKQKERIEITEIIVKMGEEDVGLTIGQARELLEALEDLLGEKKDERIYIPSPYPVPQPYPVPYPNPYHWRYVQPWVTVCDTFTDSTTTGTMTYSLSS